MWRRKVLIRGATRLWKDQMLLCGEEDQSAIDEALLIATRTRQGWHQIMSCDGGVMATCRGGLRMSGWSVRHCLCLPGRYTVRKYCRGSHLNGVRQARADSCSRIHWPHSGQCQGCVSSGKEGVDIELIRWWNRVSQETHFWIELRC